MIPFIPSPALSDCDSLASEDLERLLAAKGPLSQWPTPPAVGLSTRGRVGKAFEVGQEGGKDVAVASASIDSSEAHEGDNEFDEASIAAMLLASQLPPEVLALAFNVLTGLERRCFFSDLSQMDSSNLIVAAALRLATVYMSDYPLCFIEWSRNVCNNIWTSREVEHAMMRILIALDWRLHDYSSAEAIEHALSRLSLAASERCRTSTGEDGSDCSGQTSSGTKLEFEPPETVAGGTFVGSSKVPEISVQECSSP